MSSALIAAAALVEMAKVEMRPFEFPADWSEQVKACPECQRYKGHPIQLGICNEHRQPLNERERHDTNEARQLPRRRLEIAADALRKISHGSDLAGEWLDPENDDLVNDIACEIAPSGDEEAAVEIAFYVRQTIGNLRQIAQRNGLANPARDGD